jgi:hypothetical protein
MGRYAEYLLILIQKLKETEIAKMLLVSEHPHFLVGFLR